MSSPNIYSKSFRFTAHASHNCIQLPAPPAGIIQKLVISQVDGALEGFIADILDRQDACEGETSLSDNSSDDTYLLGKESHKVCPTLTVNASDGVSSSFAVAWPYENKDEQDSTNRLATRALYLDLDVAGNNSKNFTVSYVIAKPGDY